MCRSKQSRPQCSSGSAYKIDSAVEAAARLKQPNSSRSTAVLDLDTALTVFIFDWDDTLFPTSALTAHGPEKIAEALEAIDAAAEELLTAALCCPRSIVVILTNASLSWVYQAAESFLPKVNALLAENQGGQLSVISAHRGRASLPQVGTPAFEDAIRRSKGIAVEPLAVELQRIMEESESQSFQVISIGDQPHDLTAAHTLKDLMKVDESFVKTVLMKVMPTGAELEKQLRTLCRCVPKLMSSARSCHQSMQAKYDPQNGVVAGVPTPMRSTRAATA